MVEIVEEFIHMLVNEMPKTMMKNQETGTQY